MGIEIQKQPQAQQQQTTSYTVEQLVALNPYNPDILPDLENYVNEQVMTGSYCLDANLCLLRLYQFEPVRMSTQIIAHILIKALMAMPASDFSLCLFLIPERVQMEEQFKTLIVLSHYLETARFRQFWEEASKSRHILEAVPDQDIYLSRSCKGPPTLTAGQRALCITIIVFGLPLSWHDCAFVHVTAGFEQAVQNYAVHILSLTCQRVPRTVLAEAINIEGLALDKFLEHQVAECGWILEKSPGMGQIIILPHNEFNHPELKKNAADSIQLEHITRIFPILG